MKKVFTHENRMIVYNLRNLLAEAGIATQVRNEFAGGGVGDLAPFETWPELWIEDEARLAEAEAIVDRVLHAGDGDDWICGACREPNPAAFDVCWKCGRSADEGENR